MKEGDTGTSQHLSETSGVLRAEMEEETLPRCAEKVSRFLMRGAPCYVAVCCSSVKLGVEVKYRSKHVTCMLTVVQISIKNTSYFGFTGLHFIYKVLLVQFQTSW